MRVERQVRYAAAERPRLHELLVPERLAWLWREPLVLALVQHVTPDEAVQRILAAHTTGTIDTATTRRLAGYVTIHAHDRCVRASASTEARTLAHLAELGIHHLTNTPLTTETRELLTASFEAWHRLPSLAVDPATLDYDPDEALLI